MIYRTLGRTGKKVSAIGIGGWHLGLKADWPYRLAIRNTDPGRNYFSQQDFAKRRNRMKDCRHYKP